MNVSKEEYVEDTVMNNILNIVNHDNLIQPDYMSYAAWMKLCLKVMRYVTYSMYDDDEGCITDWDMWESEIIYLIQQELEEDEYQ